jgi:hypothetical protein
MAHEGGEGVRRLLVAAIGCNLAWGVIDAIMYLMNVLTENVARARLIRAIRSAPDERSALQFIERTVEKKFGDLILAEHMPVLAGSIMRNFERISANHRLLTRHDLYGAIACFWLVFASCLPAALPFLVIRQPYVALRVSNVLLLVLLFLVGKRWGEDTGLHPMLSGFALLGAGLLLVGIAILLGG